MHIIQTGLSVEVIPRLNIGIVRYGWSFANDCFDDRLYFGLNRIPIIFMTVGTVCMYRTSHSRYLLQFSRRT